MKKGSYKEKIALASLKKLAIGLAFTGISCLFTTTPVGLAIAIEDVVAIKETKLIIAAARAFLHSSLL